jgi:hypothetical protein
MVEVATVAMNAKLLVSERQGTHPEQVGCVRRHPHPTRRSLISRRKTLTNLQIFGNGPDRTLLYTNASASSRDFDELYNESTTPGTCLCMHVCVRVWLNMEASDQHPLAQRTRSVYKKESGHMSTDLLAQFTNTTLEIRGSQLDCLVGVDENYTFTRTQTYFRQV